MYHGLVGKSRCLRVVSGSFEGTLLMKRRRCLGLLQLLLLLLLNISRRNKWWLRLWWLRRATLRPWDLKGLVKWWLCCASTSSAFCIILCLQLPQLLLELPFHFFLHCLRFFFNFLVLLFSPLSFLNLVACFKLRSVDALGRLLLKVLLANLALFDEVPILLFLYLFPLLLDLSFHALVFSLEPRFLFSFASLLFFHLDAQLLLVSVLPLLLRFVEGTLLGCDISVFPLTAIELRRRGQRSYVCSRLLRQSMLLRQSVLVRHDLLWTRVL